MPRPKADMTIIIRYEKKGQKKSDIIKIYEKDSLVSFKTNKKWFDRRRRITPSKMGSLVGNFVEKKLSKK